MDNHGLLTTAWSTPAIIVCNVVIFVAVPQLSVHVERHHTRSSQHMHMLTKMVRPHRRPAAHRERHP
jgi:hypothetical protein